MTNGANARPFEHDPTTSTEWRTLTDSRARKHEEVADNNEKHQGRKKCNRIAREKTTFCDPGTPS